MIICFIKKMYLKKKYLFRGERGLSNIILNTLCCTISAYLELECLFITASHYYGYIFLLCYFSDNGCIKICILRFAYSRQELKAGVHPCSAIVENL